MPVITIFYTLVIDGVPDTNVISKREHTDKSFFSSIVIADLNSDVAEIVGFLRELGFIFEL